MAANKKKTYIDAQGNQVPAKYVKMYDKERDRIALRICDRWLAARDALAKVKNETLRDIEKMRTLAEAETGVSLGGEKGNLQFRSFDGGVTVFLDMQAHTEFDERLNVAQQLVMEAVQDMTKNAGDTDLAEIATRAFTPRKSGRLDMYRIRELRSYNVKHPKWIQACEIISECERVIGSRQYIRVQKRDKPDEKPVNIALDIAKV